MIYNQDLSNCIRFLSMDMVQRANSGHPGLPMGMADVATILFKNHLKFNCHDPKWINRDRFVLSGGHGSALLYNLLYLTGYDQPNIQDLKNFRVLNSPCAGHPEFGHLDGIETTTGPLGQGLATAVGMCIAQKKISAETDGKIDYKVYTFVGDGDLQEGISHEALSLAGHLNLNNLIVLFDDNQITIDGPTSLSTSDDTLKRFESYGFEVLSIDGHDFDEIDKALTKAKQSDKPFAIFCRTIIAKGAPTKAGTCSAHGSPLGEEEIQKSREALNWPYPPFVIPEDLLSAWRSFSKQYEQDYLKTKDINPFKESTLTNDVILTLKKEFHAQKPKKATRQSFEMVLTGLSPYLPNLIGGSADLTPSNNTKVKGQQALTKSDFRGSYLHFGIREHAMGAILNGLSLSGFLPYGGTFLVFSDYMRASIRLSALMKRQVFYVLTHDSIGLGEDGPTHQPIEHITSLRMIPNLRLFRPCDASEMLECFESALDYKEGPSVFALSRQNIAYLRESFEIQNLSTSGAYILSKEDVSKPLDVTLLGTGSEVEICMKAKDILKNKSVNCRVLSVPCLEIFNALPRDKKQAILGAPQAMLSIEAGSPLGFESFFFKANVQNAKVLGINEFGASGKAEDLYTHFGLTPDKVVEEVLRIIG
ncbi:MAG: transketolase [Proteobacteria bacterium]|nr:transketolase [Pseudomonadota bacterium]